MAARGSPKWYRDRREGPRGTEPVRPPKSQDQQIAEALERLQRLADERDRKDRLENDMTTADQAAQAIRQALRPIDNDGQSYGGPDGWSPTSEEIREWELTFREAASPAALVAILDEMDRLRMESADLRNLLESRPAINAGLPQTYIDWTHKCYAFFINDAISKAQIAAIKENHA